jgi:hypothetical protein
MYSGFNFHGSVYLNNILIYIQQDATLHSLFNMETAVYWNILTTHVPINVKSLNNTSKWQMGFNSAFNLLAPEFYI